MAISKDGGSNPTAVQFVKDGVTKNVTEVWYHGNKVWPDVIPANWKLNFSKTSYDDKFVIDSTELPLVNDLVISTGGSIRLKGRYSAVGYPKIIDTGNSYTVNFDGGGVKTYTSKQAKIRSVESASQSGWWLYTAQNNTGTTTNVPVKMNGKNVNAITNDNWTLSGPLYPIQLQTYWWRPIFDTRSSTSVTSITLPSTETVNHHVLTGWKKGAVTYKPGVSYTPSTNGETFTAVWGDQPSYKLSWGNMPSNIRITVNGKSYTSAGSDTLYKNSHGYATYSFTGDATTVWSIYNDGVYTNSFTGNYNVTTGTDKVRGTITFNETNHRITITEYNY